MLEEETIDIKQHGVKEEWKEFTREDLRSKFKISNFGRVYSYPSNSPENPILLSGYKNAGYNAIPTKKKNGKKTLIYVHKLVADFFVANPNNHKKLIFKDRDRTNCHASNLRWVGKEEYADYMRERKSIYDYRPNFKPNTKLTPTKVAILKKLVNDPNRKTRYRIIAKRFGINITTLFSIKRGDSWKDIAPLK